METTHVEKIASRIGKIVSDIASSGTGVARVIAISADEIVKNTTKDGIAEIGNKAGRIVGNTVGLGSDLIDAGKTTGKNLFGGLLSAAAEMIIKARDKSNGKL